MEKHTPKHSSPKLHKRIDKHTWGKRKNVFIAIAVFVVAGGGLLANQAAHAATAANTLALDPSGGTYTVGDPNTGTVSVQIRENSGATGVYSEQVGLSYPSNLMSFSSIDYTGTAFGINTQLSK